MNRIESARHKRIDAMRSSLSGIGIATMVISAFVLLFGAATMAGGDVTATILVIVSGAAMAISGLVLWAGGEALWILWEIREQLVPAPPESAAPPATPEHPGPSPVPSPPAAAAEPQIPAAHSAPTSCPSCGYRINLPKGVAVRPGQTGTCPVCKTKITV